MRAGEKNIKRLSLELAMVDYRGIEWIFSRSSSQKSCNRFHASIIFKICSISAWKSFGKHARATKSINASGKMFPVFLTLYMKLARVGVLCEKHLQRQKEASRQEDMKNITITIRPSELVRAVWFL